MVDSFGKPGSGILDGNQQWFGSFEQCKSAADYKNTSTNVDFSGLYCLSNIRQGLKVGSIRISLKEKFNRIIFVFGSDRIPLTLAGGC